MRTRRIGRDGPEVSVVGLGCNNFGTRLDAAATKEVVDAALDAGVTLFDTADVYGQGQSEEYLGAALRGRDAVIATKWGKEMDDAPDLPRGSREYLRWAVDRDAHQEQPSSMTVAQSRSAPAHCPSVLSASEKWTSCRYCGSVRR